MLPPTVQQIYWLEQTLNKDTHLAFQHFILQVIIGKAGDEHVQVCHQRFRAIVDGKLGREKANNEANKAVGVHCLAVSR